MNTDLLRVGDRAPEFEARGSDGHVHALSQMLDRGPVALVFYPGNNTPG